jgi:hypothetical protein
VVNRLPAALAAAPSRLARLTDTWLRRRFARTWVAYRRDLQGWLVYCAQTGVDPLRARAADGWIVAQRLPRHRCPARRDPRPPGRRGVLLLGLPDRRHRRRPATAGDPQPGRPSRPAPAGPGLRHLALIESPSHVRRSSEPVQASMLAALLVTWQQEITDQLVQLLISTVHHIGLRAETKVFRQMAAEFTSLRRYVSAGN